MVQQLVLGGRHRLVPRFFDGDRAEQLIGVPDRDRPRRGVEGRERASLVSGTAAGGADPGGQVTCGRSCAPTRTQTSTRTAPVAPASTDAIRSSAASASSCPAMSCGEVGEHLVGRGPLPVHDPVRDQLGPAPQRLEQQRDRQGRRGIEQRAARVTGERPDAHHDAGVNGRERRREQAIHDGAVDDDVDLVQAVLEDRERDDRGNPEQRDDRLNDVGGDRHRVGTVPGGRDGQQRRNLAGRRTPPPPARST